MIRRAWPLAAFVALVILFAVGLTKNPRAIPSPLIGKPAPSFELARLSGGGAQFSPSTLHGQVWLFNVWASWCAACLEEHPILLNLAAERRVPIVGLNYKDQSAAALRWLARHGDPYTLSVSDTEGLVGIDYGVYGVPETFVVDKAGIIRHKHVGPLTARALSRDILPLISRLQGADKKR